IRGAYLVHGENWAHPHASPTRADLRNYPPTFIATGTADPLVDDNRAFAQKLRAAGGKKVEHFVREGMPHGFYFFPGVFEQGDDAFGAVAKFLKQAGAAGRRRRENGRWTAVGGRLHSRCVPPI